jgi:hypothetical protein
MMAAKRYAATEKIEVRRRIILPGEVVSASDFDKEDGLDALVDAGALEPYDSEIHSEGWHERRYAATLDKATVKAGGIPRAEADRSIRASDSGASKER